MIAKIKKTKVQAQPKKVVEAKSAAKPGAQAKLSAAENVRVVNKISPPRSLSKNDKQKGPRVPQFAFMKAPGITHDFQVGDTVEVYCDMRRTRNVCGAGFAGLSFKWIINWWPYSSARTYF